MFKHILLATDGSPASAHSASLAVNLARTHGAKLTALYVSSPYPFSGLGETNSAGLMAYTAEAQRAAALAFAEVESLCSKGGTPVELQEQLVEDAAPDRAIVQNASVLGADLVVMGSHGRTGITRFVMGSTVSKVVPQCPVPVLIAR
jgi:nucleotide-binding universal stress UspA family protein